MSKRKVDRRRLKKDKDDKLKELRRINREIDVARQPVEKGDSSMSVLGAAIELENSAKKIRKELVTLHGTGSQTVGLFDKILTKISLFKVKVEKNEDKLINPDLDTFELALDLTDELTERGEEMLDYQQAYTFLMEKKKREGVK